jgi:hypothetical protein
MRQTHRVQVIHSSLDSCADVQIDDGRSTLVFCQMKSQICIINYAILLGLYLIMRRGFWMIQPGLTSKVGIIQTSNQLGPTFTVSILYILPALKTE